MIILPLVALAAFFYVCNPAAAESQSAADFFSGERMPPPVNKSIERRRHKPPLELHALVTKAASPPQD